MGSLGIVFTNDLLGDRDTTNQGGRGRIPVAASERH